MVRARDLALCVMFAVAVMPLRLEIEVNEGQMRTLIFEPSDDLTALAWHAVGTFYLDRPVGGGEARDVEACNVERLVEAMSSSIDEHLATNASALAAFLADARVLHAHYNRGVLREARGRLAIGTGSYANGDLGELVRSHGDPACDAAGLTVGKFCSIAKGVEFFTCFDHETRFATSYPFAHVFDGDKALEPYGSNVATKGGVDVGNDVWIGRDAIVMSGVAIGHGAVVGARAIVTRDVRPYAVVAGNPAREVKRRFDDATVELLLELRWWDWPRPVLERHVGLLQSLDLAPLFAAFPPGAIASDCAPPGAAAPVDRAGPGPRDTRAAAAAARGRLAAELRAAVLEGAGTSGLP